MNQEQRSERSRTQSLDAALQLFSHNGYGATSVADIAEEAGVSKGNVYHHFSDKETIFRELLDVYFGAMSSPEFPFNRALATGTFPENLEQLGRAAREQQAMVWASRLGAAAGCRRSVLTAEGNDRRAPGRGAG